MGSMDQRGVGLFPGEKWVLLQKHHRFKVMGQEAKLKVSQAYCIRSTLFQISIKVTPTEKGWQSDQEQGL